jgi:SAM-dependent methyltransferase
MVTVTDHYDAYPYPARDPADEARRLITGSPSIPAEIDHHLFGGQRDWSKPLRALVAGGGTGDGLVQLAQLLTSAGRPYDITYVDLSAKARQVAEARASARGLTGITFVTGSLLDAPELGIFDYIDCCGVLHHLPDPAAGFAALRAACAADGGLGFMVYAPYGRSGVYPLQEAFGALFDGMSPSERLAAARDVFAKVPAGHPFRTNPHLGDHGQSDSGFYDLLLHSQDRSFDVDALLAMLDETGWELSSFCMPALYDLVRLAPVPAHLSPAQRMAIAEKLRGTLKVHVGYAAPKGAVRRASGRNRGLIPHLKGVQPRHLAQAVAQARALPLKVGAETEMVSLPVGSAPLIAAIDGQRNLAEIAGATGTDPVRFGAIWSQIEAELAGWGLLLYSQIATS